MILYDCVIFDLDGTIVDSAGLWCGAMRTALTELYAERGIAEAIPDERRMRAVIGTPAPESLRLLLPKALHRLVPEVTERVRRIGSAAMREGPPPLFPGVRETLEELRGAECRIAIATNAGHRYRDACLDGLGLRDLVDYAYCLDSPGVATKPEMVRAILREVGSRRAVMVGDRAHDRDAAHANGVPFVAFLGGYGVAEEFEGAEEKARDYAELRGLFRRRGEVLGSIADEILRDSRAGVGSGRVGVTGPVAAGKSLFADDLARLLRAKGVETAVVRLDDFPRAGDAAGAPGSEGDHLGTAFDLDRLRTRLHSGYGANGARGDRGAAVVLVEGVFLLDPRIRGEFDRVLVLDAPEEILLRRIVASRGAREGRLARERYFPAHAAFARRYRARDGRVTVLNHANCVSPVRGRAHELPD